MTLINKGCLLVHKLFYRKIKWLCYIAPLAQILILIHLKDYNLHKNFFTLEIILVIILNYVISHKYGCWLHYHQLRISITFLQSLLQWLRPK